MSAAKKSKTTEWGLTQAVEAVSHLEGEARERLLEEIRRQDPEVAKEIEDRMFRFEDLLLANEKSLGEFLRQIPEDKLCLSLRGASPDILGKFFSCFSQRKVEMLSESISDMGPQPKSKVEEARAEIIHQAKRWVQEGSLVLSGKGERLV